MRTIYLLVVGCVILQSMHAQSISIRSDVDSVLRQVEQNNKAITANRKYLQAQAQTFKTGLTPYDPFVEYDYMFGSPAGAGNQRDFAVTQRFDFPTAYKRKKNLSSNQVAQTGLQQQVFRQDVLLEAKLLALHVIYLNRKTATLQRRVTRTEKLAHDIQFKVDRGEAIILDLNKAKLQLLKVRNELVLTENEKKVTLTKLIELNGGNPVTITDTLYPQLPAIPDFETLDSTIEANDPVIKVYEQEKSILSSQIGVQKAMNLPKLETGYHSQGILGQSYKGFHVGISVPLWENKNRVNAAKAGLEHAVSAADAHRVEHRQENRQAYDQLGIRMQMMQEHTRLLQTLNNEYLLEKALSLGQITVVQYFYEESFYFNAYDQYLTLQIEYQKAAARLFKYLL